MVRTQMQLTEEQAAVLKRVAATRHLSVAELIRQAVDLFIRTSTFISEGERRSRAIDIAGRFGSGKKNISKEHDSYLAEALR